MIENFSVEVPAPSGPQTRTAYVYLPQGYSPAERYPVLYMFDGQTLFYDEKAPYGESWRMGETLDRLRAKLLVAAVECDKTDRLTEYSPFPFTSPFGSSDGKGEEYMKWFTGTFKPMIDARFATDPTKSYIAGSSMGGLMTLYALCKYPQVFSGGAALSPSLWVAPEKCRDLILGADCKRFPALYLDYGEKELENHGKRQKAGLSFCFEALLGRNAPFHFHLIRGGVHNEKSWRAQIPSFLEELGLL